MAEREELTKEERELLEILSKKGASTPIEISVEQLKMPDEVSNLIVELENKGYVSRRQLRSGPEREAIVLSEKGMKTLKK